MTRGKVANISTNTAILIVLKTISTMRTKQKPFYANSKTESKVKSQVSRNIELYEQKAVNNYKMKICYIDYLSSGQPLVQSICFIINLGVPLFMS